MARIPDPKAAELGRRYLDLTGQIRTLEEQRDEVKAALLAEFTRRPGNAQSIEHGGVTITRKASRRRRWLAKAAKDRLAPSVYRKITVATIDPDAVAVEHKAGRISDDDLAAICEHTETAPYIVVTVRDAA